MNVLFNEVGRDFYFSKCVFSNNENSFAKNVNSILIGDFSDVDQSYVSKNYINNMSSLEHGQDVDVYIKQMDNDDFDKNCSLLIKTLIYINENSNDVNTKIFLVTDNFSYYYREFYSRLYLDTSSHNRFNTRSHLVLSKILIKKYLGLRFIYLVAPIVHRFRRFIRRG